MALTGGHKCLAPPFQPGDRIEAKEVLTRAFGPKVERWVPMLVREIRHDNKMVLGILDKAYPPTMCVPFKEGWFRKAKDVDPIRV
jgi:hypothetical protein